MDNLKSAIKWERDLHLLLRELPDFDDPRWTKERRRKWILAFVRYLDLSIKVGEPKRHPLVKLYYKWHPAKE